MQSSDKWPGLRGWRVTTLVLLAVLSPAFSIAVMADDVVPPSFYKLSKKQQLDCLELDVFRRTHNVECDIERISRLEDVAFGKVVSGKSVKDRLSALVHELPPSEKMIEEVRALKNNTRSRRTLDLVKRPDGIHEMKKRTNTVTRTMAPMPSMSGSSPASSSGGGLGSQLSKMEETLGKLQQMVQNASEAKRREEDVKFKFRPDAASQEKPASNAGWPEEYVQPGGQ